MTQTLLVPDWDADPELCAVAERLYPDSDFHPLLRRMQPIIFDAALDSYVVCIDGRITKVPSRFSDLPFVAFKVLQENSVVTPAIDGPYEEGDITARVETFVQDGVSQQNLSVTGSDLQEVNRWFDELRAGKKNHLNSFAVESKSLYPLSPRSGAFQLPKYS